MSASCYLQAPVQTVVLLNNLEQFNIDPRAAACDAKELEEKLLVWARSGTVSARDVAAAVVDGAPVEEVEAGLEALARAASIAAATASALPALQRGIRQRLKARVLADAARLVDELNAALDDGAAEIGATF